MSGDARTGCEERPGGTTGGDHDRFSDASTHFYRAEVDRMITWRTRLDQTTNWTVVVMAAILTWAFSGQDHPHYVLLVGALATVAFLLIEAQRYQEYDAWRSRVRLLQEVVFAEVYAPGDEAHDDRLERLGEDLREPSISIPYWAAVSHRLARIYFAMLTIVLAAWTARVTVFVTEPATAAAAIEDIPGVVVIAVVTVVYVGALGLVLWSFTRALRREFSGEADVARPGEEP